MKTYEMFELLGNEANEDTIREWYGGMTYEEILASLNESYPGEDNEELAETIYNFLND